MLCSLIGELMSTHAHVKSIDAQPSAMGYITKALAQIGMGQPEEAMQIFDLAFGNCSPKESNLLLLIKVCNSFKSLMHLIVYPSGHYVICDRKIRHSHFARSGFDYRLDG